MDIWSVGAESPSADPRTDTDDSPLTKLAEPVIKTCDDVTRSMPER